jgi:hypothetical protein
MVSVIVLLAPLLFERLDIRLNRSRIDTLYSLAMNLILKFPLEPHLFL